MVDTSFRSNDQGQRTHSARTKIQIVKSQLKLHSSWEFLSPSSGILKALIGNLGSARNWETRGRDGVSYTVSSLWATWM